jgi:Kef-type K+ transport system membrane component KefB
MTDIAGYLHIAQWPPRPDVLFWISLTLVGGALLGEAVFRALGLPRIVGYSAAGMVIAVAGAGLGEGRLHGNVRLIVDLALGLLLFELGSRVSLRWLRANPALLWTSAAEALASFGATFGVLRWLGLEPGLAFACAALTLSASGAVIGRVSSELKSAGQVTERMIVLSALNTLYAVLALKLVIGWQHLDQHGDSMRAVVQPLYTLLGSVLLAALLARAVASVVRRFELRDENSVLLLLGLILLALTLARLFGLSTLLVPLLAGAMLRNASERPCIWPRHFGTAGGVLVLMLFVVVGASWSIQTFVAGALAALGLLAARALAKGVVLVAMARPGGIELRQGLALALTLMPVSATTLVLLADLRATHPAFADRLAPVMLSAIAVMALVGPIVVEWGLRLAGEHHPRRPAAEAEERP